MAVLAAHASSQVAHVGPSLTILHRSIVRVQVVPYHDVDSHRRIHL